MRDKLFTREQLRELGFEYISYFGNRLIFKKGKERILWDEKTHIVTLHYQIP